MFDHACGARPFLEDARGFGLAEAVVSAGLLVAVAAGVAQLVSVAVKANDAARRRTVATVAAVQKMEQLRALTWRHVREPSTGTLVPFTDTTTDVSQEPFTDGGRGLQASPPGSLVSNMPFYADHLSADGRWVGAGAAPPDAAVLTRRWSVRALASDPEGSLVIDVLVTAARAPPSADGARPRVHDVRLTSVRTRQQ